MGLSQVLGLGLLILTDLAAAAAAALLLLLVMILCSSANLIFGRPLSAFFKMEVNERLLLRLLERPWLLGLFFLA